MNFEFDPGKNELNQAKHGLSLEDAQAIWAVPGVEVELGAVNRQFRYARLASIAGVVHVVIYTYTAGPAIRLISARKANAKESAIYEQSRKK